MSALWDLDDCAAVSNRAVVELVQLRQKVAMLEAWKASSEDPVTSNECSATASRVTPSLVRVVTTNLGTRFHCDLSIAQAQQLAVELGAACAPL